MREAKMKIMKNEKSILILFLFISEEIFLIRNGNGSRE
jgi:hypothetical protein